MIKVTSIIILINIQPSFIPSQPALAEEKNTNKQTKSNYYSDTVLHEVIPEEKKSQSRSSHEPRYVIYKMGINCNVVLCVCGGEF